MDLRQSNSDLVGLETWRNIQYRTTGVFSVLGGIQIQNARMSISYRKVGGGYTVNCSKKPHPFEKQRFFNLEGGGGVLQSI